MSEDRDRGARVPHRTRRRFIRAGGILGLGVLGGCADRSDPNPATPQGSATASASDAIPQSDPDARRRRRTIMAGTDHETTVHGYHAPADGPTTLVIGGMHGDERSGYTAAAAIAEWTVDTGQLYVIPRSNAVGVERGHHDCDHGDLNAAFPATGGPCDHWVAQAIWDAVVRIDPDWTFDLHASYGIYQYSDGVGQAMFPTWAEPARRYGAVTVAALNGAFDLAGPLQYELGHELRATSPMLIHRLAGVLDRPGYICETYRGRGTPLADQVDWHTFCVEYTMAQAGQRRVEGPE